MKPRRGSFTWTSLALRSIGAEGPLYMQVSLGECLLHLSEHGANHLLRDGFSSNVMLRLRLPLL